MSPRVVVVGPPGAGKSTVAALIATRLGEGVRDTDADVERTAGRTISEIFVEDGEPVFRELERRAVLAALAGHDGVLALGGGAVMDPGVEAALAGHLVVFLDVLIADAARRVGFNRDRPLLVGNPRAQWNRLMEVRRPVYSRVATVTVATDGRTPDEVADEVIEALRLAPGGAPAVTAPQPHLIRVGTGSPGDPAGPDSYDVVVGRGLTGLLPDLLPGLLPGARRVLVVHAAPLRAAAEDLRAVLASGGAEVCVTEVPDAEAGKTAAVAARCWQLLGRAGFTRSDAVVGVGGGAVTDLAGFVAATWLRGVRVVQVPTTLLAMVDAAVGGKTGINTDEGKNLVGAFHPPAGVLCDLGTLATLPERDLVSGLAEVVKTGFIADPRILELTGDSGARDQRSPVLRELVERSVAVKARVVTEDLKESSLREILNYGHTFAHAIEQVENFTWRHGDAVAVGMVFAAELGRLSGRTSPGLVERHRTALAGLGLPVSYRGADWDTLLAAMRRDKKTRGDLLRFVVLEDVGRPVRLEGPDESWLEAAYAAVSS
ncbi:MAG: shikimate kinase / 3-dehydroquinate synthase [Actinomycetota bacterium]|nr:shikimate kinase / 3-dehydroquinate synthase [Actinomycetota bacterium]